MIISDQDRQNLIKYRMEQAEEAIDDVQLLLDNNRLRSAVNRIYYGMFYSLMALGLANKFETSKHAQLIGWFNKNIIHSGLIDIRFGKMINKAFSHRSKSDYDSFIKYDKALVSEMFEEMKEFIKEIKTYL